MKIVQQHFITLESTNLWLKNLPLAIEPDTLLVVSADMQTCGQGRRGNKWFSPQEGNLYVSFGLDIVDTKFCYLKNVGQIASLAVAFAVKKMCLIEIGIKWPNDLFYGGLKFGGILCETVFSLNCCRLVVGIGVNVNISKEKLLQANLKATSLQEIYGESLLLSNFLDELVKNFSQLFPTLQKEGFKPFVGAYSKFLLHKKNDFIEFRHEGQKKQGSFQGITEEGLLLLKDSSDTVTEWVAGEIL